MATDAEITAVVVLLPDGLTWDRNGIERTAWTAARDALDAHAALATADERKHRALADLYRQLAADALFESETDGPQSYSKPLFLERAAYHDAQADKAAGGPVAGTFVSVPITRYQ